MNGKIEQYNTECSDKCLAGFVKCGDVCKLNSECCVDHNLVECLTNNHAYPATTPDGTDAVCHNWCCGDDEYFCGDDCIPMIDGPPTNGEITEGTQSDDGIDNTFPKECCVGQECCEGAENFNLDTFPPQCCEQGT